jgi:NAD(P) transhydrogenase subunit alpha
VVAGRGDNAVASVLGIIAVACATINIVGGFIITDRMLKMFGSRQPPTSKDKA